MVINKKKHVRIAAILLVSALTIASNVATSAAAWSYTLSCGYTGGACPGLANICPAIQISFDTKALCEQYRSLTVTACIPVDTFYYWDEDIGSCDGHCSANACSGSDSAFGGGGAFSNFAGDGISSGAGGLGNNFGATRLTGPYLGEATFTSHSTTANKQWMEEMTRRFAAIGSLRDTPIPETTRNYEQDYLKKAAPTCADNPGVVCLMDATREAPNMDVVSGKKGAQGGAPPVMGGSYGDGNRHIETADVPPPPKSTGASGKEEESDITETPGWTVFESLGGTTIDYACKSGVPAVSGVAIFAKATLTALDVSIRGEELNATEQERRLKLLNNVIEQQKQAKTPEELAALTKKAEQIKFNEVSTLLISYGTASAEKVLTEKLSDKLGDVPAGLPNMREALAESAKGGAGELIGKATETMTDTVNKITFILTTKPENKPK